MKELRETPEERFGIIYKATNTVNGKVYIGMTIKSLADRKSAHLSYARNNPFARRYFIRAINKYSEDAFKWDIIDKAKSREELTEKEKYWILFYNSYGDNGYNLTIGGEGLQGYAVPEKKKKQQSEMIIEMWENGLEKKMARGSLHHSTTLKDEDVLYIKDLLIEGKLNQREIGELFGVTQSTVFAIRSGRTWRHVITDEDIKKINEALPVIIKRVLTEKEESEIKKLLLEGLGNKEISEILGIASGTISSIKTGRRLPHLFTEDELKVLNTPPKIKPIKPIKIKKEKVKVVKPKIKTIRPKVNDIIPAKRNSASLTKNEILEIKNHLAEGMLSQNKIAKLYNIHQGTVSYIKHGQLFSDIN